MSTLVSLLSLFQVGRRCASVADTDRTIEKRGPKMQHVVSEDGTRIAYEKTGQGPALIVIGGALGDHRFYIPLADELATQFTVYNL